METKQFKLNGENIEAKELTIGQFKIAQKLLESDNMDGTIAMVAFSTGKEIKDIEAMPSSSLAPMVEIVEWLTSHMVQS